MILSFLIDSIRKGVLLAFLLLLFRQFFVLGLIVPLRLESGSMVPAFFGPRYEVVCEECRHVFFCGADGSVDREFLTCPDCGFVENPVRSARLLSGERILIDRLTPPFQRFDTIVYRNPESPSRWSVKRIAALPGETVAFHDGNLWIDGELYRKTLDEQRKTVIPYPFGHWNDESPNGKRTISFDPSEPIPHFAPLWSAQTHSGTNERDASFFSLRNPYNQLRRERPEETRMPTDEILLTFPKNFLSDEVTITTKYETIGVKKTDAKTLTIQRNGKVLTAVPIPSRGRVEISVMDRTFQLGDGDSTLLTVPLPNDTSPKAVPEMSPVVFRSDFMNIHEVEIRIDPYISDSPSRWVVPKNHYFVLGDNTAISEDSRHQRSPFVPKDMILGIARRLSF